VSALSSHQSSVISHQPLAVTPDLEALSAEEVLAHAVEQHGDRVVLACSFQKESSVLIDMLSRVQAPTRVFTIDTGVLFPETRDVWRALEQRYGLEVEVHDALSPDGRPWTADRCCSERKVAVFEDALEGADAWISGLRREQAPTRATAQKLAWEAERGVWKYNPLADWTEADVWRYINERDLPYHPLHDRGYGSIGCMPCTSPGIGREGRWAGTDKTECGLHA
jgi:phosphoadenosine phosphosulfate reductase